MKLRKILAGFLAGAIAMTSSVVMSVTASAANVDKEITGSFDEWGLCNFPLDIDLGTLSEEATLVINYDCSEVASDAYPAVLTQFNAGEATDYGYVVDTHQFAQGTSDVGSYELKIATLLDTFSAEYPSISTGEIVEIRLAFWNGASCSEKIQIVDKDYTIDDLTGTKDEWGLLNISLPQSLDEYPDDTKLVVYYDCSAVTSDAYPAVLTQFNAGEATDYGYVVDTHQFAQGTNDKSSFELNLSALIKNFSAEYPDIPVSQITEIRLAFWNGASATGIGFKYETPAEVATYSITAKDGENGEITGIVVNEKLTEGTEAVAEAGATIGFEMQGDTYYTFDKLVVTPEVTVETTDLGNPYFVMPAGAVTVYPVYVPNVKTLKTEIDSAVSDLAALTEASTYTVEDYAKEITAACKSIDDKFAGTITVDTTALTRKAATEEATGSITGTVTISADDTEVTTLTANVTLSKVPTDPVKIAAEAVNAYLKKVTFDNDFHATNQAEAIVAEVAKVAPTARVDANFRVKVATTDEEGFVKGTIAIVADGSEPVTIEVNEVIAKLPKEYDDNKIALETLKEGTQVTQTATQKDGKLSQRFVQKVSKDKFEGAKAIQYTFKRNDGKKYVVTDTHYYASVAGVTAADGEAFLSVTMKNIPADVTVTCAIEILYN